MRLAIDAGHGGIDPGAYNKDIILEKDVALQLALFLYKKLEGKELEIINTRIGDDLLFLDQRVEKINAFHADYFISVHTNFSLSSTSQGIVTYYRPNDDEGWKFANIVQQGLVKATGRPDLGVRDGNLYLFRKTNIPGCQVEMCFINNLEERQLLLDNQFLEQAAQGIAGAIIKYFDIYLKQFEPDRGEV